MTQEEFDGWRAVTERSKHHWNSDLIHESRGEFLFYIGGVDGRFISIDRSGLLRLGEYEDAYPHIGEASFKVNFSVQCSDREAAFKRVVEAGGTTFLLEITGLIQ
jgi:hypothetical protein